MRLYVSGPMSGIPDYNFPAFTMATTYLRTMGHTVFSPAEMDAAEGTPPAPDGTRPADAQYAGYLARDIRVIAEEQVEGIVVLPGWEDSGGAKTEVAFALALGLPVFTLDPGVLTELPDFTLEPIAKVEFDVPTSA